MKTILTSLVMLLVGCRIGFDERPGAPDGPGTAATIEVVQDNGTWGTISMTANTVAFPSAVGGHHAILVAAQADSLAVTVDAFTDTVGNTYQTVVGPIDDNGLRMYLAVALDTVPGATAVTATYNAAPHVAGELFIAEYRGVALADAVDDARSAMGGNFGLDSMQSVATTHGDRELLYAFGIGPCVHAGTGFALRIDVHGDITEDQIVDAGAHQTTATSTCPGAGDRWQILVAALRPQLLP